MIRRALKRAVKDQLRRVYVHIVHDIVVHALAMQQEHVRRKAQAKG